MHGATNVKYVRDSNTQNILSNSTIKKFRRADWFQSTFTVIDKCVVTVGIDFNRTVQ